MNDSSCTFSFRWGARKQIYYGLRLLFFNSRVFWIYETIVILFGFLLGWFFNEIQHVLGFVIGALTVIPVIKTVLGASLLEALFDRTDEFTWYVRETGITVEKSDVSLSVPWNHLAFVAKSSDCLALRTTKGNVFFVADIGKLDCGTKQNLDGIIRKHLYRSNVDAW